MAIEFEGLEEVLKKIQELGDTDSVRKGMGRACALVEGAAKQNAPKDTGALRNSIQSRVEDKNGEVEGVIFTPLEYAPYIMCGA